MAIEQIERLPDVSFIDDDINLDGIQKQMIRDYQEQYQKDQEAEWKLYQEQTRTGLIHSMDFDASDESTWHSRNLQKLFTHGAHAFYTEKE